MSKLKVQCLFLFVLFIYTDCEVYQDRPKIKTSNGDLILEPGYGKNIYLLPNGPKSTIFVGENNILKVDAKTHNSEALSVDNAAEQVVDQNSILRRLEALEQNRASPLPNDLFLNISTIWRKVNNLNRKVLNLQVLLNTRTADDCQSQPCQHGGTCLNLVSGYHCLCPSNWEGKDCDEDVDECRNFAGTDLGCQNGASCKNLPGSYECNCRFGWHGLHCTGRAKDCSAGNTEMCGHGRCLPISSGEGFTCICDQGWTTNGTGVACTTDVNECDPQYGPRCSVIPKVKCTNLPGSFRCGQCPSGYEGDGFVCSDIDECVVLPNGGCSPLVSCHNTIGSRICGYCPPGYEGDGVICTFRGSCNINNGGCHPSAHCTEVTGFGIQAPRCMCPDGMEGEGVGIHGCYISSNINDTQSCANNPCGAHGTCHLLRSGYTCICQQGYGGSHCDTPANHCENNPCRNGGICRPDDSLPRGFRCECTAQYSGPLCQVLSKSCSGVLDNEEGSIIYPLSNTTYNHHSKCAWVIHTVPGKVINVTFTKFNIEESPECGYDFLQIHDGRSTAGQLLGRFCGNNFPNGGNIISSDNYLYFWFKSDGTVAKDGFALHWTSITPICGGELDALKHGNIGSPGSPGKYPPNRDCYWHLTTSFGKRIQVHFFALDIETHANCSFDYLAIYDGTRDTDPLINKYCTSTQPAPIQTAGSEMLIHFHSDSFGSGYGFQLSYAPIEGVPGCGGFFTSDVGEILSPSFNGSYLNNVLCEYKIRTSPGTKIRIDFNKFRLESSFKCRFDYLKIYDGDNSDSPLVGKFCGNAFPSYYVSSTNNLFMKFKSDLTIASEGFKIMYKALCHIIVSGDSGIIKSPGYPIAYPNNKVCEYIISTTPGKAIQLSFQDFDIEDNRYYQCMYDYVEVRDGSDSNSTLLGKFCGGSDHIPPTQTSTHNYLYVKFNSDMSISGTGFYANYTTIGTECGGIYRKTTGLINLPSDGTTTYKNELECTWVLVAPAGMHIKLTWNRFDIESMPSCGSDSLELIEIDDTNEASSLGKFCGTKTPPALTTSTNRLMLKFVSDSSVRLSGFSLSYTFLDEKLHCGGTLFRSHGFIYSPGWPKRYETNRDCTWTVNVPVGQLIRLNISQFDLERPIHDTCHHGDYLEIRNGASETAPLIGQFCGKFSSKIITSLGNAIHIHFHSDFYLTGNGFKLEWDGSLQGCGGTLSSSTGAISSPNYPNNYNENSECFYRIVTNLGSRIRLSFTDLELERTSNCKDDYVEIHDGRNADAPSLGKHCYMSAGLNSIETTSNYAFIKFRSDFYNEGKGFLLNYYTICNNNLTGRYGVIESPDYPNNYPLHLNCLWNINVFTGNKINVTFTHFDIFKYSNMYSSWRRTFRKPSDCDQDFLQWKEPSQTTFSSKACGNTLPAMITTEGSTLQIKFSSGGFRSRSGFRLEWVNYGCGGHIQKPRGAISLDSQMTLKEVECEWLIETPTGTSISLIITDLYVSNSVNCTTDFIEAYNGQNVQFPLISKICNRKRTQIQSTSNFMLVRFVKRSNLKGAYFTSSFVSQTSSCGGLMQSLSGYIYSKNYPKNYDDNLDCNWLIVVPSNHRILLTFEDLDLYSNSDMETENDCGDSIKIYDIEHLFSSNFSKRICPGSKLKQITTKSNKISLQFTSDNTGTAKGFKANYTVTCGGDILVKTDGIISNDNYIGGSNSSCVWTLNAQKPEQKIYLTITHLYLPQRLNNGKASNTSCSSSYVRILDGDDVTAPLIDEYCGQKAPPVIISHGSTLTVILGSYTNEIVGHFSAHYSTLSMTCGGTFTSEEGSIVSPNYPHNYPAEVDCEWNLSTSAGNKVSITFEQFALEDSEGCNEDYLEIRENTGAGPLLGVFCGNNVPINITSAQVIYIKFHTNNKNSDRGFLLHYGFIHGNNIEGLESGTISSPLYPHQYYGTGEYSWRIYTDGVSTITLNIDKLEIHSYSDICISKLSIFDGYDETAPLIDELCGILIDKEKILQTSSNLVYIRLKLEESNSGAMFHMTWSKTNKIEETNEEGAINCGLNYTVLVNPGEYATLQSPNYPNEYNNDMNCEWIYQASSGRHLKILFQDFDLEEINHCFSDYVNIYSADVIGKWKPVLENICEFEQILLGTNSSRFMKVTFKTDSSITRKGFTGKVMSVCGSILTDLSGEIAPIWEDAQSVHVHQTLTCEWSVKVRPGRVIKLKFIHFNITNSADQCFTSVTLRNGETTEAPLLGNGRYCGYSHENRDEIITSSNSLHITFSAPGRIGFNFVNFKIHYEEKSVECGVTSKLDADNSWEIINSPNYPNLPTSFSECVWTFSGPPGEILRIDFIDRFDLDSTSDCSTEVVEIHDGSSVVAPLKGQFCGEKPGTVKTSSNTVLIRYLTQLPVPRNGFKANVSIDVCGGTIIAGSGEITSPGYPHYATLPPGTVCEWRIKGPPSRVFLITPKDLELPETEFPCATKVNIEENIPGNKSIAILKTYCKEDESSLTSVETLTNEVVIKYYIGKPTTWFRGLKTRGFRISFNSSRPNCGGVIKSSEGFLASPGYPIETSLKYCQWTIMVPNKNRRVRIELLDIDPEKQQTNIANDPLFLSTIANIDSGPITTRVFESSGPILSIYVITKHLIPRHKFKAKFTSDEAKLCGGDLNELSGEVTSLLDRSYLCDWHYNIDNPNNVGFNTVYVTGQVNSSVTRSRCRFSDPKLNIQSSMTRRGIFSRVICGNTEFSYRIPAKVITFKAIKSRTDSFNINFKWKSYPCGGAVDIGEEATNIIKIPESYNDTLECAWVFNVPYGSRLEVKMEGQFDYNCDDEFIKINQGFSQYAPALGHYCKSKMLTDPLYVNYRFIYVEYHTKPRNYSNIKLLVKTNKNQCGGQLSDYRNIFMSPNYPKNYESNQECTWTITTGLGNRVSLQFIERFVVEYQTNCSKDAVIIYDWKNDDYNEIARVCGRQASLSYNSTFNKMKVVFRTDATTNMEGFKALWSPICGGTFLASNKEQFIYSPGFPRDYFAMQKCLYEIKAPEEQNILIKFVEFTLEGNQPECQYDNLTVTADSSDYKYMDVVYCGNKLPPSIYSFNKINFVFRSDMYVQRKGFKISYIIYECGGKVTEPTTIKSNINDEYENNMNCTWHIQAPVNKIVVLKFIYIDLESNFGCYADYVAVFDGAFIDDDKRLAVMCGKVNSTTVIKTKSNQALLQFISDQSFSMTGFKVEVIFSYSESVGCGGYINMTSLNSKTLKSFISGNNVVYENYLDCTWTIISPLDTVIKIEFNSFHISSCRNVNQTALGYSTCNCDFVEIRDGINPDSTLIGKYCGHTLPPSLFSSGNIMSVRLSTDGEITSSGFEATITKKRSLCGQSHFSVTDTSQNIKSPGFSDGEISRGIHCVYYLDTRERPTAFVRISVKTLDLQPVIDTESNKCNRDKLVISASPYSRNTTLSKDLIINFADDPFFVNYVMEEDISIPTRFEFCGSKVPSDLYFTGTNLAITLLTSPDSDSKHRGVELEFSFVKHCGRNYTGTQGKIIYQADYDNENPTKCGTLITAPENHTISAYFISVVPDYWNYVWYLNIYDGNNTNASKLGSITNEYEELYPAFFSSGRYLLLHQDNSEHMQYDLNFVTSDKGRGCGGKLSNELGRVTSPMYPNIYRQKSTCEWEIETPASTRLKLHFAVFDLGISCDQNYVQIVNRKGDIISSYCSEKPADYVSTDNYVKIVFITTMNNGGTGWVADFIGILDN